MSLAAGRKRALLDIATPVCGRVVGCHAATLPFRPVKCLVGTGRKIIEVAVIRGEYIPYTRADKDLVAINPIGLGHVADDPPSQHLNLSRVAHLRLHDNEFVAAQPRGKVALAEDVLQSGRDGDQQGIADGMAVEIVDRLEPIEVETK